MILPFAAADCFISQAYGTSDIQVSKDVVFGKDQNPWTGKTETLMMDVYFPPASDTRTARPVVIHSHGGAYVRGDKGDNEEQMRVIASRGYVAASINYRLVPLLDLKVLSTRQAPKVGAEDIRAAVRFMRKQASAWNLDETRIALSGNSAGAMSSLYHAYAKKEQSEGNGGHAGYSSAVNAIVSVSGSLMDRALCTSVDSKTFEPSGCLINAEDDTKEMSSGDIPVVFLHGTADLTVPYLNALEAGQRANKTGVRNLFLTIPDATHVPMDDCLSTSEPYLHQWVSFLAGALNTAEAECPPSEVIV